jgi:hypothetical protein
VKANDGRRGDRSPLPYLCSFALDLGSVVLSAVTEMPFVDSMSWIDFEPNLFSYQRQVSPDAYAQHEHQAASRYRECTLPMRDVRG